MSGHLRGVVQASCTTIAPEQGNEAAMPGCCAEPGTLELLRQLESRPVHR